MLSEGKDGGEFSKHPELHKAWHGGLSIQNNLFCSLKTLKLVNCDIEPCAIPSNILPCLNSLKDLEVRNCKKVELIFAKNDTDEIPYQLNTLILEDLSELTFIWEEEFQGILGFQNLQKVSVTGCKSLQTLLPAVLAENLKMLERLEVKLCDQLQEIVGMKEDEATVSGKMFSFPQLTSIDFEKLLEFKYFYSEIFTMDCPKLNFLSVLECPKLELFQGVHPEGEVESISTSINRQLLIPNHNVISIMEELYLDLNHMSVLRLGQTMEDLKNLKNITLYFDVVNNEKTTLPLELLEKVPTLQHLCLGGINNVEVFLTQNTNGRGHKILAQLKTLALFSVSELKYINLEDSWLNTVCEKLYNLKVLECPDLKKLFRSPSAVSFSCMKELHIRECHGLRYLFTCSVAKVLATLEKITVIESKSIIEIVAKEQGGTTQEVKFERLCYIELNSLSSLKCFYSGNETLQLPSLTQVDIWQCPNVEVFSQGEINVKSFRGIQASSDSSDQLVLCNNDLNASVKRVFLLQLLSEGMDEMKFSKYLEVKEAWHDEHILQNNWFYNLTTLKLVKCDIEPYAIPSNILPCLKSLKELEVRNCNKVKVIFSNNVTDAIPSQLINLTLEDLSELTLVWEQNFQEILKFQYLQQVSVIGCKSIQTLFPAVLAENFKRLKKLEVKSCDQLREIVGKEVVATGSEKNCWFPRLTSLSLDLNKLQELTCFYTEIFTVEWPELDHFSVLDCPKLKLFQGAHPAGEAEIVSASNNRQPFILNWCFCNLISLVVEGCEFLADAVLPSHILPFLSNLKTLEVRNCNSIKAIFVNTKIGPQGNLCLPFLENLHVENCKKLLEIVAKEEIATNEADEVITVFPKMKFLTLLNLHNLKCIYPGVHILEWPMLIGLDITQCPQLKFFATEFQSSQDLHSECPTILQAFVSLEKVTPSLKFLTLGKEEAKMIEQGKLHVDLQEIVALRLQCFDDKTDVFPFIFHSKVPLPCIHSLLVGHSDFQEIFPAQTPDIDYTKIHSQLMTLELKSLPQLESIGFEHSWFGPLIENLHVLYCARLTNLAPSTVSFSKLEQLNVQNCDGLKSLFTSSTAKTLSVLKKINLVNCESIIEIVAKEEDEPNEGEMLFMELSILTLRSLPKLGSFYSGSFTLNFSSLEKVSFTQCNSTKVFRLGDKLPDELKVTIDGVICEGDNNDVIIQQIDEAT